MADLSNNTLTLAEMNALLKRKGKTTDIPDHVWVINKLPIPIREYRFHPIRRWRFDFAWPDRMLAIEIHGGLYSRPVYCDKCKRPVERLTKAGKRVKVFEGGRHTSSGFINDLEKENSAQCIGWTVLKYTPTSISYAQIKEAYEHRRISV